MQASLSQQMGNLGKYRQIREYNWVPGYSCIERHQTNIWPGCVTDLSLTTVSYKLHFFNSKMQTHWNCVCGSRRPQIRTVPDSGLTQYSHWEVVPGAWMPGLSPTYITCMTWFLNLQPSLFHICKMEIMAGGMYMSKDSVEWEFNIKFLQGPGTQSNE